MSKPISQVERFFNRYNFVTFISVAALSLAGIVFICYNTYIAAVTPSETPQGQGAPAVFDKKTAEEIDKLHEAKKAKVPNLPTDTRINPFVE